MEQNSLQADSHSSNQEIPRHLRYLKFHYRVHKSPQKSPRPRVTYNKRVNDGEELLASLQSP